MALLYEPRIFKRFSNVAAAITLRGTGNAPYGFNMSLTVGDDPGRVRENRARLATRFGFDPGRLATQMQVHGDVVAVVADGYRPIESDAMISSAPGWLLAVSVADCLPVLMYDPVHHVVAGVHSGWRGTQANITGRTVERLREEFDARAGDLHLYIGAGASQCCYEVGDDVALLFDPRYCRGLATGKYLFDNKGAVLEQALAAGIAAERIELDTRCTICDAGLHSYRRDGMKSGRMFAVIGMH